VQKVYIKFCRPYEDMEDEPPIEEVWSEGERPAAKLADQETLYVYDNQCGDLLNERLWDGIE